MPGSKPKYNWDNKEFMRKYIRDRVFADPNSGCWLWAHELDKDGYGQFRRANKTPWNKAHRISHWAFNGPIPDGLLILHKCNVPSCVNPDHLYAGTPKQNTADRLRPYYEKARRAASEAIPWHRGKLGSQENLGQTAKRFGVGKQLLRRFR